MAKCLLLGGNGFLGRNLASELVNAGYEVVSADLNVSRSIDNSSAISYLGGDLSNPLFVDTCLQKGPFDYVFLLACSLIPSSGIEAFTKEQEFQKVLGYALPERMKSFGSQNLVFFSSGGAIYGNNGLDLNHEKAPLFPISHYGKAKKLLEASIMELAPANGINYLIVRPSNPYGNGQRLNASQGLIAVTLGKALRNESIEIWGNGESVRDYLHVSDLIRGLLKLIDGNQKNEVFNIGSGKGYSVNQILETIELVVGRKLSVNYSEARSVDVKSSILDISKIYKTVNWQPEVSIKQGISELWVQIQRI
jgi:UDP-glucose 4-epimerase